MGSSLVLANTLGFALATVAGYVEVVLTILVIAEIIKLLFSSKVSGAT